MDNPFAWLMSGSIVFSIVVSCCATLLPLGIIGGIGYFIYRRYQMGQAKRQESQAWLTTTGVVMLSRVEVHGGGDSTRTVPMVVYQYQVNGQPFQGNVVRAGSQFFTVQGSREPYVIVDRYPVGAQVVVYYNPANPAECALER
ncbi:MAG: DUF3592 domain-containing protein [Anaerolineales bacterium]|nr:DUF3592 domain-containing protein [Anaerolineales bacterium]